MRIYPVAVIGGGAAGIQAVLRSVLNNDECLFFPGTPRDKKRSRALWVRKIENMPAHFHYKKGIEDPVNETLKWIEQSAFASKLIMHKNLGVGKVEKKENYFEIRDSKGQIHYSEYVILCTGVMDVQPLIMGSMQPVLPFANAQSIDYCLRCDGHHVLNNHTAIIGDNNGAAWVAIMLHERYQPPSMTILLNGGEASFTEDAKKLLDLYHIRIIPQKISAVLGPKSGELQGFKFVEGEDLMATMAFVSMGMLVYNELAKDLGVELDERGFVKADPQGETSVKGFFVAGDVMANTKKQIYTAWDTAVNAADTINQKLRQKARLEKLKQV